MPRCKATKRFDGLLGKGICFNGNEGQLPGYTIKIENGAWNVVRRLAGKCLHLRG